LDILSKECLLAPTDFVLDDMLEFTRRLLALRRGSTALALGDHETLVGQPDGVFAYRRFADGERYIVVLNFDDTPVTVSIDGELVLATTPTVEGPRGGRMRLGGLDGAVLRS